MTIQEKQYFVKNTLPKLEEVLTTPVSRALPTKTVEEFDEASKEIGYEFSWKSFDEGQTYILRAIGMINGFLAKQCKTMIMKYDEDSKRFIGVEILDNTIFGEPVENMFQEATYEDFADEDKNI